MEIPASDSRIRWFGRAYQHEEDHFALISSGAYMTFILKGHSGKIRLRDDSPEGEYNYISFEVNGKHSARFKIPNKEFKEIDIPLNKDESVHHVSLIKETEASCGSITISHVVAEELLEQSPENKLKIEFIGNSITAGMSSDPSLIACETNKWYDQHNAFMAYGPRTARLLNADYMIAAVSGMGAYRNWNTNYPVMGDVYEHTFLTPSVKDPAWKFDRFMADIVCINLGTNDFADGDGMSDRLPFDSLLFIEKYTDLIAQIGEHYPDVQLILLQMQWPGQSYKDLFATCLKAIKKNAESRMEKLKPIQLFAFSSLIPTGCSGHPGIKEHEQMANELTAFIQKNILGK